MAVACAVGGYTLYSAQSAAHAQDDAAKRAATEFASAWASRHLDQAAYVGMTPAGAAANFATATAALGSGPITVTVQSTSRSGDTATADLRVGWKLPDGQTFSWTDPVALSATGKRWAVQVRPGISLWHPKLRSNDAFTYRVDPGSRGEVLGKDNAPIMTNATVHDVNLDPTRATAQTYARLEAITGITGLAAKYEGTKALTTIITYRDADYAARKAELDTLPGVSVSDRQQPLAPTRGFAQPILGTVGPVTAELMKQSPGKYHTGQIVGLSGLQARYQDQLAAHPGAVITARSSGAVLMAPKDTAGKNVVTTLDPRVQTAADNALATLAPSQAAALVAIDVRTGNVLAASNWPTYGMERALSGHYTPGSTLKVVTSYALLAGGFDPDTVVDCPSSITIDGKRIGNFEGESLPHPSFRTDFAQSCNTAFVKASEGFTDSTMHDTAALFDIGGAWAEHVGMPAYSGSVPVATSTVEKAVTAFGQARTQMSPLAMAAMVGDVARCATIPPVLVTQPSPGGDRAAKPLDAKACSELHQMMRLVVTDGTGTALKDAAGGPVYGKTGTAEVSDGGQTGANAWFAGWQGNIAFAVLVPDVPPGQSGGSISAPLVKAFLGNLAAGH